MQLAAILIRFRPFSFAPLPFGRFANSVVSSLPVLPLGRANHVRNRLLLTGITALIMIIFIVTYIFFRRNDNYQESNLKISSSIG